MIVISGVDIFINLMVLLSVIEKWSNEKKIIYDVK